MQKLNSSKYTLQQVKQFIEEQYFLDWKQFKVLEDGRERRVLKKDLTEEYLSVVAVVYKNNKRLLRLLIVTNTQFKMHGENNQGKPELWQKYISKEETKQTI